jgi:transposase InsO family protein
MTAFWTMLDYWELTLYFDVFTKQILGRGVTRRRGLPDPYYDGLEQALAKLEGIDADGEPVVIHTDQGSVYTSMHYNEIIKEKGLVRSCSRAGKPTDNPVNESLNGWIKEELFFDFGLYDADNVANVIDAYIGFYNTERPSYSLGYDTPDEFYRKFMTGEIEGKDTFKERVLDETPKFIRKKRGEG